MIDAPRMSVQATTVTSRLANAAKVWLPIHSTSSRQATLNHSTWKLARTRGSSHAIHSPQLSRVEIMLVSA